MLPRSREPDAAFPCQASAFSCCLDHLTSVHAAAPSSHLRELGWTRTHIDAIWRACPMVILPGTRRPVLRVEDYLAYLDEGKCSEGRVGSASAGISQHMLILDRHFGSAADRHCWDDHRVALPPP